MDVATAGQIATSQAVWAIVALLLGGAFFKKLYNDSSTRENRLIEQEKQYREESKEREKQLNEHLDKSIEANQSLSETQKEIVVAINGLNGSVKSLENRMDRFEKKESA